MRVNQVVQTLALEEVRVIVTLHHFEVNDEVGGRLLRLLVPLIFKEKSLGGGHTRLYDYVHAALLLLHGASVQAHHLPWVVHALVGSAVELAECHVDGYGDVRDARRWRLVHAAERGAK